MLEFISQFIKPVATTVQSIFITLAILSGATVNPTIVNSPAQEVDLAPIQEQITTLGANISALADFRSSLTAEISSTATSMTLESFTSGSDSLTIGRTYGFKLGGREYVTGEASTGNTIINMSRGISRGTGTSTVTAYQSRWGRGTAVEITDAPILIRTANVLGGIQTIENTLKYDSSVATSTIDDDNRNLVNYELLAYTAFNGAGVINASATQKGLVEIATQVETASSTSAGSTGALLAIPASNATSTYNAATAALRVVTTQNNGKIDPNFIATSTLFVNSSFTGTTTMATSTSYFTNGIRLIEIGKNTTVITNTGTSTFTVPSGVSVVNVKVVGGGGGGGNSSCGAANQTCSGGGGGGGGYAEGNINVSGTTSIQVFVGSGGGEETAGTWSTFGTNGFYLSATGGNGAVDQTGNFGGNGSGGHINIPGGKGGNGQTAQTSIQSMSGMGGSTLLGVGGTAVGTQSTAGNAGTGYGGGGGGSTTSQASGGAPGGSGAQGIIIINW